MTTVSRDFDFDDVDGFCVCGSYEVLVTPQECTSDYGNGQATERWDDEEIVSVEIGYLGAEGGEITRHPENDELFDRIAKLVEDKLS